MGVHFVPGGHGGLYRMWAGLSAEIVLACDRRGRVNEATAAIAALGYSEGGAIIGQPVWTLATDRDRTAIADDYGAAIARGEPSDWREVTLRDAAGRRAWYELRIEPIAYNPGLSLGAICVLRSIAERRRLEREAFTAALTDPLTGFTNRRACVAMLDHLAAGAGPGCLALLDLDHFRAHNLRHGHAAGDRLLVAFADLLRKLTRPDHILCRIDGGTFALILPGLDTAAGTGVAEEIREALFRVGENARPGELPFTASFGLASLDGGSDAVLRAAEIGLAEAKAKGRNRIETGGGRLRLGWRWGR